MKTFARWASACAVCAAVLGCASGGGTAAGASAGSSSSSGLTVFGTIDASVSKTTR